VPLLGEELLIFYYPARLSLTCIEAASVVLAPYKLKGVDELMVLALVPYLLAFSAPVFEP
jgi:hypothetical protein